MTRYTINAARLKSTIAPEIFGHFAEHLGRCIYGGIYVGKDNEIPNTEGIRNDVLDALREMKTPVLRWPGGCFADTYHWRDGIGSLAERPSIVNVHWGGVTEDNSFGTHEFMRLCELVGCEPYINGNLGSGTIREMSEWVEYLTFAGQSPMTELRAANGGAEPWRLRYFGVGNENWGCGGNMTAHEYSAAYRRYQTYLRGPAEHPLYKIACGPNEGDVEWTESLMKTSARHMDGLTLHYYTITGADWDRKGSALEFDQDEYYTTIARSQRMETLVAQHAAIMDRYDPGRRVGLLVDEWGTWFDVEPGSNPGFLYQQNTMRDAMVAASTLSIFCKAAERVRMANIAQTVNVLQAPILTNESGLVRTPTFHVFSMMAPHQGGVLVDSEIEYEPIPGAVSQEATYSQWEAGGAAMDADALAGRDHSRARDLREVASVAPDGAMHVTIANMHASEEREIDATILGHAASSVTARVLTGDPHDHNVFTDSERVIPRELNEARPVKTGIRVTVPPVSVVALEIRP